MFIKSVISWKEVINLLFDYLPQSVLSFRRHWWWTVCLRTRLHQHGVKHSQQLPYSLFAITQAWGWVLPYLGAYGISYVAISSLVSKTKSDFQFSSVQSLSHVRLFATPWTTACQAFLSITISQSPPKPMSMELMMPSNHLVICWLFSSRLHSFTASGSFSTSQLFASGGQSIEVSASISVLPVNIQDWFPLGWTDWISLQSKGLSRVFSNTTVQKHLFFSAQLSL